MSKLPEKIKIDECAKLRLDEPLLSNVEEFIAFLRSEKINLPWTSINGFDLKYKGKRVGKIYFREGPMMSPAAFARTERNCVELNIDTAERDKYEIYLEGQPNDVVSLFTERVQSKCVGCRPTCECSRGPGMNIYVSGEEYKNICIHATGFQLIKVGGDLQAMHLQSNGKEVAIATVKRLVLARKRYIDRTR